MESIVKSFIDDKLGQFLQVDKGNVRCNPSGGDVSIRRAAFRPEVFEGLHFPIALRGGSIEEISIYFMGSMFRPSGVRIVIKNVFLLLGHHKVDWARENVIECKARLVDTAMKVYELKGAKKKTQAPHGGYFAEVKKLVQEEVSKAFLGMLEIHVSNVHIRYEDPSTQTYPFSCGFKIGHIGVNTTSSSMQIRGDWKHSTESFADPLLRHAVQMRRVSCYWDIGKRKNMPARSQTKSGDHLRDKFLWLNLRETFSTCVVEEILKLRPPEHPRRKRFDGPGFRERFDFHEYILFPVMLNAHLIVNRDNKATRHQRCPAKDADVVVDPLEVAIDTAQIRSINQLLAHVKVFFRQDMLLRSRPNERISSTAQAGGSEHSKVVRAWWLHAVRGVRIVCELPHTHLDAVALRARADARSKYVALCVEDLRAKAQSPLGQEPKNLPKGFDELFPTTRRMREMQLQMPLIEIFESRLLAKERWKKDSGGRSEVEPDLTEFLAAGERLRLAKAKAAEPSDEKPSSLQVRVRFHAFQGYLLVTADELWCSALPISGESSAVHRSIQPVRQLVVRGSIWNVQLSVVQKGHRSRRIARWIELGVGNLDISSSNAKTRRSAVQLLGLDAFRREPDSGAPVCLFLCLTSLETKDRNFRPGDTTLEAVLEPWLGIASHLKTFPKEPRPEKLEKLAALKEHVFDIGRVLTFGFVRVGYWNFTDYTPFRRRLLHFLRQGRESMAIDLVRRPSTVALDRELLTKLQRKVEKLTGKSNGLACIEGQVDGIRLRMVDHYNKLHLLCKELSLAPISFRLLRNGKPQWFNLQMHQMKSPGDHAPQSPSASVNSLPWKVQMLLLQRVEFDMGLGEDLEFGASGQFRPLKAKVQNAEPHTVTTASVAKAHSEAASVVIQGSFFWKWGRNGKAKRRFVAFDEKLEAVAWKAAAENADYTGAMPLSKVQDVCVGVVTPVMQKIKDNRFDAECALSIISLNRTLDLQADTPEVKDTWVIGLRAHFREFMQRHGVDESDSCSLPKRLGKMQKTYQHKYRSERCSLRSTFKKLQTIAAWGRATSAILNP